MQTVDRPLIVQSDRTILAEVHSSLYPQAREALSRFAELVKSPEHIHTYRLTPLSIWNAASAGMSLDEMRQCLEQFSKYPVPSPVLTELEHQYKRYGLIRLIPNGEPNRLLLEIGDDFARQQILRDHTLSKKLLEPKDPKRLVISKEDRGFFKQALIKKGYPVVDEAGYILGDHCDVTLRETAVSGKPFTLRDYQRDAVKAFYQNGSPQGGNGVVVMPCGAGKTVVGLAAMAQVQMQTLIITTGAASVRQWMREVVDKTTLTAEQVGEYSGETKQIRPVTVATYQILTYTHRETNTHGHFDLMNAANWGLIIYDEVHLLPAPLFRMTADLQARRRLGLTATLVREDSLEDDVFSLIGPKRYDAPWKDLESKGWIAEARCYEIRIPLEDEDKYRYAASDNRSRFKLAAANPNKMKIVQELIKQHQSEPCLVIGQYLDQLHEISKTLNLPLITGQTTNARREELYQAFRKGEIKALVVSRVANFSIDLPEASVLIETSGLFGSRQEEAQRLGRVLRPKAEGGGASFYTLVSEHTVEQEMAQHRQLFLAEQGYRYQIVAAIK